MHTNDTDVIAFLDTVRDNVFVLGLQTPKHHLDGIEGRVGQQIVSSAHYRCKLNKSRYPMVCILLPWISRLKRSR